MSDKARPRGFNEAVIQRSRNFDKLEGRTENTLGFNEAVIQRSRNSPFAAFRCAHSTELQ